MPVSYHEFHTPWSNTGLPLISNCMSEKSIMGGSLQVVAIGCAGYEVKGPAAEGMNELSYTQ